MMSVRPVIMAGGIGSRLWPISSEDCPKQFFQAGDILSSFQKTMVNVTKNEYGFHDPYVVCHVDHLYLVKQQLKEIECYDIEIVVEPVRSGTNFCVNFMMNYVKNGDYVLFLPADHEFDNFNVFVDACKDYLSLHILNTINAPDNHYVPAGLFGIKPLRFELNYGYIESEVYENAIKEEVFSVKKFFEKPNHDPCEGKKIPNKHFFWNSGIFLIHSLSYKKFHKAHQIAIKEYIDNIQLRSKITFLPEHIFSIAYEGSYDANIKIEKTALEDIRSYVIDISDSGWMDVGNYREFTRNCIDRQSIVHIPPKFKLGNVYENFSIDCVLIAEGNNRIVASGLKNILVLSRGDTTYVLDISDKNIDFLSHQLRDLVQASPEIYEKDLHVTKPWGKYDVIHRNSNDEPYKIKLLVIEPGQALSVQRHRHREEHWIIQKGVGVVIDEENYDESDNLIQFNVYPGAYVKIKRGAKHSISNIGKIPLELIEIQLGEYLGEDDIERISDLYARKTINE